MPERRHDLWILRGLLLLYLAWLGITAIGVLGYLSYQSRYVAIGLLLLGIYATAGLDGLLHYTLAPMHAHAYTMNFTIWFEVAVAAALLIHVFFLAGRKRR